MKLFRKNTSYSRNPIYVFYALGALVLLFITTLLALRTEVGVIEQSLFNIFYFLPSFFTPIGITFYVLGSALGVSIIAIILLADRRTDIVGRFIVASSSAFLVVHYLQQLVERGRPETLLDGVVPAIQAKGFGFPAVNISISVAAGLTIALYLPRRYRQGIIIALLLVGCSSLFLGLNLPLDVAAGWLIGIACYSLTSLALGSVHVPINADKLAKKLETAGLRGVKLKSASVDARGSVPFFGEYEGGKLFVKVFNKDNNAADWLFKVVRRMRYRRLEDEVPALTPKRAIEHEAYLSLLAKYNANARVPEVVGIFKVANSSYAMATKRIEATGLDKIEASKITDKMLEKAWQQVKLLHEHRIIHKDLRTANIMIEEKKGLPWIIDFGFSECAVEPKSFYKDNMEFIASTATRIGAKRSVAAAIKALGQTGIDELLPYTQYAVLSGATTSDLKKRPNLLSEIRDEMITASNLRAKDVKPAKLNRVNILKRPH